jgi:16S rRNA processing protein RimM
MSEKYIECGKIINTHGCKGGIKVDSWCNSLEDLAQMKRIFLEEKGIYKEYKIKRSSMFKQFVLFDLEGITDMDQAMALKNSVLYALREEFDLEDGEYFIADVIGLPVIDVDTLKQYGTVKDVVNRGASDIYVVDTPCGESMIPAVDEFIKLVDLQKGVFVRPIEGMFETEDI